MTDEEYDRYIEITEAPVGIPFLEFLNGSTNLITIFGILNALVAYTASVKEQLDSFVYHCLFGSFFVLSIIVWYFLIQSAYKSDDRSFVYKMFIICCIAVELGLIIFFAKVYPAFVLIVTPFALFFLFAHLLILLFFWLFKGYLRKKYADVSRRKIDNVSKYISATALVVSLAIIYFVVTPVIKPIMEKNLKEQFNRMEQKDSQSK